MFDKELKELEGISQAVGISVDLVQGGGGNTSVKLNAELMAVKASGFKLSQITPTNGYVAVNYKSIQNYYKNVDLSQDVDFEKESVDFVKKSIVELEGIKSLRPSVEAGFHSILKKYVIHTHPVYANILCCSQEGKSLAEKIFQGKEYSCIWIPYINPGFCLTLKIKEEIDQCQKKSGNFPKVAFMQNHGLIVTSDDYAECISLHAEVNETIKKHLEIKDGFPEIALTKVKEDEYLSQTRGCDEFFKSRKISDNFFDEIALYPDQLVYLNGNVAINKTNNKLSINTTTGEILYKTNYSEAITIEETLVAYLYVVTQVEKLGLKIKTMSAKDVDFIRNWESESYRKSLVKELAK